MPIISSTASDETGQCYNVNADTVAAEVAISLGARRLVYFMSPVYFVILKIPILYLQSAVDQVDSLKNEGVIKGRQGKQCRCPNSGANLAHFIDEGYPIAFFSKFLPTKELVRKSFMPPTTHGISRT